MRARADRIKELDAAIGAIDAEIERLLLQIPNLPDPSVPAGTTEEQNVEVRRRGTPRAFGFTPKSHEELGEALGLLDFERAAKIAKSRFTILWGAAARLERALTQFMLDLHTRIVNRDFAILDRKSTRLNSSHLVISYAVFCLKKKKHKSP